MAHPLRAQHVYRQIDVCMCVCVCAEQGWCRAEPIRPPALLRRRQKGHCTAEEAEGALHCGGGRRGTALRRGQKGHCTAGQQRRSGSAVRVYTHVPSVPLRHPPTHTCLCPCVVGDVPGRAGPPHVYRRPCACIYTRSLHMRGAPALAGPPHVDISGLYTCAGRLVERAELHTHTHI